MDKRRDTSKHSKDKRASGLLRGAAVAGVVSGLAAASLSGVPTANATCLGIFGISINLGDGGHCSSSLTTFALGIGPNTFATANVGFFNAAIAVGTNTTAIAGTGGLDFLNLAFNSGQAADGATSTVTAGGGAFNLAANLGGNANASGGTGPVDMNISAGPGFGNVAVNAIGNRNTVSAGGGFLNFAGNLGSLLTFPNGSDNDVAATGSLSAAFNSQTILGEGCSTTLCGNLVRANGPLSLVVAAGVVSRIVTGGFGITLANSFNSDNFPTRPQSTSILAAAGTQANGVQLNATGTTTNVPAASGTQGNRFRLNSARNNTDGVAASGTQGNRVRPHLNAASNRPETTSPGGSVRKSVSEHITKWAKKSSDPDSRGTGGRARDAKADADSTDGCDK
jgi:hypothetical protein